MLKKIILLPSQLFEKEQINYKIKIFYFSDDVKIMLRTRMLSVDWANWEELNLKGFERDLISLLQHEMKWKLHYIKTHTKYLVL